MILGCATQAQKRHTEKARQNFHLVNPPEFEVTGGHSKKTSPENAPFPEPPKLIPNQTRLPSTSSATQVQSTFEPTMRKAVLLYNPNSGGTRSRRQPEVESVVTLLGEANVDAQLVLTDSPAEAEHQARQAVQSGCDTVFACGGDGTIHTVIQVLANTSVALAILPLGTANALAHDLRLPMKLKEAARAALQGEHRRVALGRIEFRDLHGNPGARFFVVAAGAGVDAHLFYKLRTGTKQRMGMAAYYAKAWHLWFSYPMTRFRVELAEAGSDASRRADVTEMLAVRIRNFGGVLQELAPGAALDRDDVRVVFCRTSSRLAYLAYVTRGLLRRNWKVSGIESAYSGRVSCHYLHDPSFSGTPQGAAKIYVETDGELVGTLPAEITVVPDALTLLAPRK
jgi:YegS/Rv2252/BmrU family lipid kinase